ncbi:hypothetical protein F5148DRAFT_798770 [Russula earlei]|uniref:Uncharacterized protein n=1 Tax=Russula earlei TaxID=71964 RepID=A0ACC0TTP5_9AGAM|nr:hypothetical protein F5148DRAFT_798770 [Russula earlei]
MAGDHKCPVCQATFTRPQHVARHMRSHTGDRPYKCQHCGDQFARSDLLSRHVNKCHPNEKPLVSSAPSRRKGTASASRATTSKQACDQCVQSTLPCDGANPCSKCVHRKTRCTYVKFHRQTAPLGPGHPARPSHDSSNPAHPSLGAHPSSLNPYRLSDPFFLPNNGPLHPSTISQPTAAATNPLYAAHQFTFPPPPLHVSAPLYDNTFDLYRPISRQRRPSLSHGRNTPGTSSTRSSRLPRFTGKRMIQAPLCAIRSLTISVMTPRTIPCRRHRTVSIMGIMLRTSPIPYPSNVFGYSTNGYNPNSLTFHHDTQSHQRCESSASETGSTTSHSQPSSATSSSVHLPLTEDYSTAVVLSPCNSRWRRQGP